MDITHYLTLNYRRTSHERITSGRLREVKSPSIDWDSYLGQACSEITKKIISSMPMMVLRCRINQFASLKNHVLSGRSLKKLLIY